MAEGIGGERPRVEGGEKPVETTKPRSEVLEEDVTAPSSHESVTETPPVHAEEIGAEQPQASPTESEQVGNPEKLEHIPTLSEIIDKPTISLAEVQTALDEEVFDHNGP